MSYALVESSVVREAAAPILKAKQQEYDETLAWRDDYEATMNEKFQTFSWFRRFWLSFNQKEFVRQKMYDNIYWSKRWHDMDRLERAINRSKGLLRLAKHSVGEPARTHVRLSRDDANFLGLDFDV